MFGFIPTIQFNSEFVNYFIAEWSMAYIKILNEAEYLECYLPYLDIELYPGALQLQVL